MKTIAYGSGDHVVVDTPTLAWEYHAPQGEISLVLSDGCVLRAKREPCGDWTFEIDKEGSLPARIARKSYASCTGIYSDQVEIGGSPAWCVAKGGEK